jgi:hypothetical protein
LTGSTDRKHSLSVAINALLCLWRLSNGYAEPPQTTKQKISRRL